MSEAEQQQETADLSERPVQGVVMRAGPIWTDQGGNLSTPVLMCTWGKYRCRHFRVYDWHYPYCAAQPDTAPALRPGGGTHLFVDKPNDACPHNVGANAP